MNLASCLVAYAFSICFFDLQNESAVVKFIFRGFFPPSVAYISMKSFWINNLAQKRIQ